VAAVTFDRHGELVAQADDPCRAIDNLMRCRLLAAMLAEPERDWTATSLADRLGFHSAIYTALELDALAGAGLLIDSRSRGELRYALTRDLSLRTRVAAAVIRPPPPMLERMASASVKRVRALLPRRRR
jgi:hypothetical protein